MQLWLKLDIYDFLRGLLDCLTCLPMISMKGSAPILSVKRSVSIDMLNFDGDEDRTCKQICLDCTVNKASKYMCPLARSEEFPCWQVTSVLFHQILVPRSMSENWLTRHVRSCRRWWQLHKSLPSSQLDAQAGISKSSSSYPHTSSKISKKFDKISHMRKLMKF